MKTTRIEYRYRDADNYKQESTIILAGELTEAQMQEMVDHAKGGMFAPELVDLMHLGTFMENFPTEADHPTHELICICSSEMGANESVTAPELYEKWMAVEDWESILPDWTPEW